MRLLSTLVTGIAFGASVWWTVPALSRAEAAATAITGAWGFISETNLKTSTVRDRKDLSGIWIFADGYHCVARMQNNRSGASAERLAAMSPAEQAAHYKQLFEYVSNAGVYSVSGSTVRRTWQISIDSAMLGRESVGTFAADREELTVTLPGREAATGSRVVYRRLEPPDSVRTPVTGVWAFVSETNNETGQPIRDDSTWSGLWIFTGRHHCLARMEGGRKSLTDAELAKLPVERQLEYYRQLTRYSSTAGSYAVDGDALRRTWVISQGPDLVGEESAAKFSIKGDRMTVELPRRSPASGPAVRVVYRRLE